MEALIGPGDPSLLLRWHGKRPQVRYQAELTPLAAAGQDPGPGTRRKDDRGRWQLVHRHDLDYTLRDGQP